MSDRLIRDFWLNIFPGKDSQPKQLNEEEALNFLRGLSSTEIIKANPIDLLRVGTKLHFTGRATFLQKLATGILSPKIAKERRVKRDSPGGRETDEADVHIIQVTLRQLIEESPLSFLNDTNAGNYSIGEIDENGLLTRIAVVVDPETENLESLGQRNGRDTKPEEESIWYAPEIPRRRIIGIMLVDSPNSVYQNGENHLAEAILQLARERTVKWFKEKVIPYHGVPIYSQASDQVLLLPNLNK